MTQTETAADTFNRALGSLMIALDEEPNPLMRLERLRIAGNMIAGETQRTVDAARATGSTWEAVAGALCLASKQAAHARYA
jgi:hypothetical protein